MNKQTFFISDVHLSHTHADTTRLFLYFLKTYTPKAEAIYILGDLFNVWLGDDEDTPYHRSIKDALKQASDQVPIYFMHGNHDFMIGKRFLSETGCRFIKDPTFIDLYGLPTLLTHGDALCLSDRRHLRFRAFIQSHGARWLASMLPLYLRQKIASQLLKESEKHTQKMTSPLMRPTAYAIEHLITNYQAKQLIHGHTHEHKVYRFELNGEPRERIVLGDWEKTGSVLACDIKNPSGKLLKIKIGSFTMPPL